MVQLESALPGLLNRYEELTGKSSRSAEEQKELANVIAQIRNMVPGAATAFDQYGNAIEISGEKVEEFLKKQRALLKFENQKAIRETTEQLEEYRQAYKNLLEQQKQGGRTVFQSNGMFAAPTAYINTEALPQIEQDIKKYGDLILGAEEKLKQLNGQTIEETVKNQQKLAEVRQNFNKMEKVQLQAWIKNNKDAAGEYVEIAQEIYNKRFPAEDSDATRKKAEKAAKEAKSAAEKEQKAKVSTEQEAAKSLEALREEELQSQQKWYNESFAALSAFLASGKMSKEQNEMLVLELEKSYAENRLIIEQSYYEDAISMAISNAETKENLVRKSNQHEMLVLELEKSYAENRLIIEQSYYEDAISMAISNAETKENLVRKSNQRVIDAEKAANAKRASLQEKLNTLVKDFKSEFKVTTVDEDYAAQLKVLEASYQARKEMAEKNNLDTTELDSAYLRAKEQLESEHQQRIQSIRDQYGLSTQQERFNAELEQLRLAREQQFLTEEQYEQAVQNLKRDSYKKQFDYYSSLFSGAIQALQQAEMDQVDAKYDAEIEAAQGNTEEVERLENEKAQKKLDIQKKYADVNFAIKASQIIADTAVSIMKAYADLGPIAGSIAAALMGVTGAAQLASAKAERDKIKNMTLSGSNSGSSGTGARVATGRQSGGKIDVRRAQDGKLFPDADYDPDALTLSGSNSGSSGTGARVATGRQSGGKIDVRRAQDGKLFPDADYDPDARGFIDRPTVIVGEGPSGQSKEWVASNAAVSNPTVAPILDILDKSQQAGTIRTLDLNQAIRARMAGYSSGGSIDAQKSAVPVPPAPSGTSLPPKLMERLANAIIRIDEEGIPASVTLSELERKQELRNRSRKIGSK